MPAPLGAVPIALLGAGSLRVQDPGSAPAAVQTRLDVRLNPLIDLQFGLRVPKEERRRASPPAGCFVIDGGGDSEAQQELRRIEQSLGGNRGWGLLEGALATVETAGAFASLVEGMPETFRTMDGRDLPIRELAGSLARALASVEPLFLEGLWPDRKKALEREAERLRSGFRGKEADCLEFMLRSLGLEDPKATIPVFLVTEAPFPGAVTHRKRGGGGVCFVALSAQVEGTLLHETVLHEATHALDILSEGKGSILTDLRDLLRGKGIGERDTRFRDAPHTLMFVQAGETVRRILDPSHRHYGDAAGYYAKVPLVASVVREEWTRHLDGKASRADALGRIAEVVARTPADSAR